MRDVPYGLEAAHADEDADGLGQRTDNEANHANHSREQINFLSIGGMVGTLERRHTGTVRQ